MSEAEGSAVAEQPTATQWFPDEYKPMVEAKGWKSEADVFKSYSELEKFVGQKSIDSLPAELTPELTSRLLTKLGRPESPDKYEFKYDGQVQLDENLMKDFRQFAHGLGLTGKQFQEVVNFQIGAMENAFKAEEEARNAKLQAAADALKGEWKENYDTNFKQAKETAQKLEILDALEELGLADDPRAIKLMHKLNSQLSEATLKPQAPNTPPSGAQEMAEIVKSEAFLNKLHPDHEATMKRYLKACGVGQA